MPIEILMPALSPTMSEGTLARWLKKEGDTVKSGDILAEIETDKATMEFEAVDEGTLGKILVGDGTSGVKVNQPIALLLAEGEDRNAAVAPAPQAAAPKAEAPAAQPAAPASAAPAMAAVAAPPAPAHGERVFASPLARRLAKNTGLGLEGLKGSGPHGRIVKADVESAIKSGFRQAPAEQPVSRQPAPATPAPAAPAARPAPPVHAPEPFEPAFTEIPNSGMRKVIARRMTESMQQVPHYYLSLDCNIDALLKVREELNQRSDDYKLSVNDFVIRAVALTMKKHRVLNASWHDDAIHRYADVHIAVATATPDGLLTPVIRNADRKGLAEISNEMKALAVKARDGKMKPEDYQGGTVSISNLGMYGIRQFTAIINPPQCCIMAVGAAEQRPIVKNGALAVATMMTCTFGVDHRVADGAVGAEFHAAFKAMIEDPLSMLL